MADRFRVLSMTEGDNLEVEVREAIAHEGRWERFIELHMASGPTVAIEPSSPSDPTFRVSVSWGSQSALSHTADLADALDVADRLTQALFELRRDGLVLPH